MGGRDPETGSSERRRRRSPQTWSFGRNSNQGLRGVTLLSSLQTYSEQAPCSFILGCRKPGGTDMLVGAAFSVPADAPGEGGHLRPAPYAQATACPVCGVYFASLTCVRLRHARKHGHKIRATSEGPAEAGRSLPYMQHAVDGMPRCMHCHRVFGTMHRFREHVEFACPVRLSR